MLLVRRSTTLDWVHGLQPDDLEKFLAEKKEQRMRVLCLDLEPTGIPQQVPSNCACLCFRPCRLGFAVRDGDTLTWDPGRLLC